MKLPSLWCLYEMAAKIGVLDHHQKSNDRPSVYVKKTVAQYLVRRAMAVWVTKVMIQRLAEHMPTPRDPISAPQEFLPYEHHIEPKMEALTISNSPWLRYLYGY